MQELCAAPRYGRPLLCLTAMAAMAACMTVPATSQSDGTASQTQTAVGSVVPGPGSTDSATSGIVAGGGNVGIHASGNAPAVPPLAGLLPNLSLAASSAPDLCLAVADTVAPQSALVLRSCSADALQRWVLVNGVLQSSQGTCLAYDANKNAAVLQGCDSSNANQQLLWSGGVLTLPDSPNRPTLQVAALPATTASVIGFGAFDLNAAAQQTWNLGQYAHDGNQQSVSHGVQAQVLEAGGTCLSGAIDGPKYVACSPNDHFQGWLLTSAGLVKNEGSGMCLGIDGTAVVNGTCVSGPAAFWGLQKGVLYDANSTCLDVDPADANKPALTVCDFAKSRHFVFGLSKGTK